jgi:hypothetical protein
MQTCSLVVFSGFFSLPAFSLWRLQAKHCSPKKKVGPASISHSLPHAFAATHISQPTQYFKTIILSIVLVVMAVATRVSGQPNSSNPISYFLFRMSENTLMKVGEKKKRFAETRDRTRDL